MREKKELEREREPCACFHPSSFPRRSFVSEFDADIVARAMPTVTAPTLMTKSIDH